MKSINILLAIYCLSVLSFFSYAEGPNGNTPATPISTEIPAPKLPNLGASDFPGESLQLQSGELQYHYRDVHIPGPNGMDIEVHRSYYGHNNPGDHYNTLGPNWTLNIPRMKTQTNTFAPTTNASDRISCLGVGSLDIALPNFSVGTPVGFASTNDLPVGSNSASTLMFSSKAVLTCSARPVLTLPTGVTIEFGVNTTFFGQQAPELDTRRTQYYVSKMYDRFGNTINYEYEYVWVDGIKAALLKSINNAEGTTVTFTYTDKSTYPRVSRIYYNGKTISYDYDNNKRLIKHTDAAQRITRYTWGVTPATKQTKFSAVYLKSVTTPTEATISYNYTMFTSGDPKYCSKNLPCSPCIFTSEGFGVCYKQTVLNKTISGTGLTAQTISYKRWHNANNIKVEVAKPIINNGYNYTLFEFHRVSNNTTDAYSGRHAIAGQLYKTTVRHNNTTLYAKNTLWGYKKRGTYGCSRTHGGHDSYQKCGEAYKNKETYTYYYTDGSDTFTTDYLTYDTYNNPTKIKESNSFSTIPRYTLQSFMHDKNNWLLNNPYETKISSNNASWVSTNKTTYWSANSSYRSSPYLVYEFNQWQRKYSQYHTTGDLKKVEYNANRTIGSGNRFIQYTNYKRGIPQTITMPSRYSSGSISQTQTVDNNGLVTSKTDLNGASTSYMYDNIGRAKSINLYKDVSYNHQWLDTLITWREDSSGNQTKTLQKCVLNNNGQTCSTTPSLTTIETYDSLLRLQRLSETDNSSNIARHKNIDYNHSNQQIFSSYWSNNTTESNGITQTFDALQRITSVQDNAGTITNEYLSGNKIKKTDAEGNITTTSYLSYGSPSYQQAIKIESPENVTTDIAVNIFDNVTSITQSGKNGSANISQTEYRAYDSQQRLCQIKRNDVGATVMSRNTLGEVIWQAQGQSAASNTNCNTSASASQKVNFTYDNLGGQRTISYGDGTPTRTFTIDNNGNIKNIKGGGFSQAYHYNTLNLLEHETLTISGRSGSLTLDYGYNSSGHLASLQYPDGLAKINFLPNAFGQATQAIRSYDNTTQDVFVKGHNNKATYYPNGSINTFTYGNNVVHKTTLNSRKIPSSITDKYGSSDRVNLSYIYDDNNNIKRITNTREAGIYSLSNLNYDGLDRLTSTVGGSGIGSSTITYDGLGNIRTYRNTSAFDPSNLTYSYKSNFLVNEVKTTGTNTKIRNFAASGSYDTRGNVLKNGNRSFTYNLANQMTASGANRYVYDGYNRRIKTQDSKGTSYSFYSQSGKLLYRETPTGGINYIFLGDKLVAKEGTGVASSNDSIMNYKPFGDSIETPKDDVGYTGHKFDTDLGLSYMQARYYDPVIGRFYSNDPVGFRDVHSFNRYVYANNNPYKYIDPDGRSSIPGFQLTPYDTGVGPTGTQNLTTAQRLEGINHITGYQDLAESVNSAMSGNLGAAAMSMAGFIAKPIKLMTITSKQLGKKLGRHVQDFGGDPSSAADRQSVVDKINDIANNPDKVVKGTFSGQGLNGTRGDVNFRIQGNDVVVTTPNNEFVTILKGGVNQNTSVKNALGKK
ncbi:MULTISPECIES: RHS repeat-associated core domain-containing protein [unclassified Pseudoalteromonas]|uniref:RHS repeat-associated core domain-containing protein n=1 Tax=unclassified Pseudoalteromonas TaxID=194690 RepID=UPI0025B51345|nr:MULTISPECIES: RHS repeat-associated core domain-containing protein [unclassified Pseudoalteromonas]MDN3379188.1 RHS repeat-associated core domain-containing protein [Pseudoalteromonas sp. APC 3893]MDN3387683.1 RHS repeat-associated core domain-containing protein [Pseudoalteromonas sp. APC 4017]